jgi:hypothetical protein
VKRGSYWLIRPTMVNKNVSHVITVTTNCQGISQSSRGRDSSTCSERQLYTYCNGLYFVILTGSHFLHKNIFVKRNIHCYLNKFYEINSLYLYYWTSIILLISISYMMETIPKQKRPFLGLKVHSYTQNMRPFPYIFVILP